MYNVKVKNKKINYKKNLYVSSWTSSYDVMLVMCQSRQ